MNDFPEVPFMEETAPQAPAGNGSRKSGTRGQKLPFSFQETSRLYGILESELKTRELSLRDIVLLTIGYDTSLRGRDLLQLRVPDVQDSLGSIRPVVFTRQEKTGTLVSHALTPTTRKRLRQWIERERLQPDDFLFSGQYVGARLSRRRYADIVKSWARKLNRPSECFATHTVRRSKPTEIYERTKDLVACQIQLGHGSTACTHTYLNVTQNAVHEIARAIRPF